MTKLPLQKSNNMEFLFVLQNVGIQYLLPIIKEILEFV